MPAELESYKLDSPQRFSFIAYRHYLQQYGFDSTSIRYRATASLAHPSGEISAAWLSVSNDKPTLTVDVSLMGLYGTTSPLPAFYTERILGLDQNSGLGLEQTVKVLNSEREEGQDLKQFYDLFNHQAISLFYDAWNKYRIASRFTERSPYDLFEPDEKPRLNEFSTALLALWGVDRDRLASFKHLTLPQLMPLAGLLASRCGSIGILEQALNRFFDDTVIKTHSLMPSVVDVPRDQLNSLGRENAILGDSLVLGQQVADCSGIVVTVILNTPSQLKPWLPGGEQNEAARELISLMLDTPNDYQLELNIGDTFEGLSEIGDMAKGLGWGAGLGTIKNAVIKA